MGGMVDTALNHGGELSSFVHIMDRMPNTNCQDPCVWFKGFMQARRELLKSGFQCLDTSGTGSRAGIWIQLANEGNWDLTRPIKVFSGGYWGSQVIS